MAKEATLDFGQQFWLVMDWIIAEDVKAGLDAVIGHFMKDVQESSIPRSIEARLLLRQCKKGHAELEANLADAKDMSAEDATTEFLVYAEDLLGDLDKYGKDPSKDSEYRDGSKSRQGLVVPKRLMDSIKSALAGSGFQGDYLMEAFTKYVERAEKLLGPPHIKTIAARTLSHAHKATTSVAPKPAAAAAAGGASRKRKAAEGTEEASAAVAAASKKGKGRKKQPVVEESSEESDSESDPPSDQVQAAMGDEDRRAIADLHRSQANLRRAGGEDPLKDALAVADSAKAAKDLPASRQLQREEARVDESDDDDDDEEMEMARKFNRAQAEGKTVQWDEDEDEIENSNPETLVNERAPLLPKHRKPLGASRKHNVETSRRPVKRWPNEDVDKFIDLVHEYGEGKWKLILKAGQDQGFFQDRTTVDLKDKHRNLKKMAQKLNEVHGE